MVKNHAGVRQNERREFDRKSAYIGAHAVIANSDMTVDCTILDVSESGAQLKINELDKEIARFKLFVPKTDHMHECQVVWRVGKRLGVNFLNSVTL